MELADILPLPGKPRRLYCDDCGTAMDLVFRTFSECVSGIQIDIVNLPMLECDQCGREFLTDGAVFAIGELRRQAVERGVDRAKATRTARSAEYRFTDVPFSVDADDYYYIPGLYRPHDVGFLTPLFFNKTVLIKFDNLPSYHVRFASPTYGTIDTETTYISFGINRHGKVIMWLGDVAKLPESEQIYLLSENVPSDHSLGSEFYDGQIECKFTDPPQETIVIKSRSAFMNAFESKFGTKLYHLDNELIDVIAGLAPPLVDTVKERKHTFDSLNHIFLESIDNSALEKLVKRLGVNPVGSGSLKRLQAVLETVDAKGGIPKALLPFYVIYDLRIAYSHLTSAERREELLTSAAKRLSLRDNPPLTIIYEAIIRETINALESLAERLNSRSPV